MPSPEGSPRSMFRKLFHMKEDNKSENDELSEKKKIYQNEYSQTIDELENEKIIEKIVKNNGELKKLDKEKRKRSIDDKDESIDEIPVKDISTVRKTVKDELDPSKLTTIINNSIKEAVRNIVKDGVCDFIESEPKKMDNRRKSKVEKPQVINEESTPQNKEKSTSEEKKTFDSHPSRVYPLPRLHKSPEKAAQCDRSICPAYADDPTDKLKRSKKSNKKKCRFPTDNRRMTGNVNIYICSEANENVTNKSQEREKTVADSESDIKSTTSISSVSTTKLVNAIKKKRRKGNGELECLCEEPEEEMGERMGKKFSETREETVDAVSSLNYLTEGVSSGGYLDACSLDNCPALSADYSPSFEYSNFEEPWEGPRKSFRNYSYLPAERDVQEPVKKGACCACKKRKQEFVPCPYQPKLNSIGTNYPEDHEVFTVCIDGGGNFEKQDNSCCVREEKIENVEEVTVCGNQGVGDTGEFTICCNMIEKKEDEGKDVGESERKSGECSKASFGREMEKCKSQDISDGKLKSDSKNTSVAVLGPSKENLEENGKIGELPETGEVTPEQTDKKESICARLWRKTVALVKRPKTAEIPEIQANVSQTPEENEDPKKSQSSESKLKKQESSLNKSKSVSLNTLQSSQTLRKERRLKSKIVSRITSKQKQKESSQSDSKIPSDTSAQPIEIVPSPEELRGPEDGVGESKEGEGKIEINCKCGDGREEETKNEEPKLVPCTFTHEQEFQDELTELGGCRCGEVQYEKKEEKCCSCRPETSCQPIYNPPKKHNKKTCKPSCRSCCNPLNHCTCRMPARKCSYCGMPVDICNCHRRNLWIDRRPDKNIRETSNHFLPRDLHRNPDNCRCDRPYGSEELPYQRLNVFSNVMTELQQKISDSTYCPRCNNAMCCCPKTPCLSTIAERPNSPNESPPPSCKCSRFKKTTFAICDVCQTSPCRCRRDKRPQAKCFYCKTSPCRCNWTNDNKRRQPADERRRSMEKRPKLCQCPMTNNNSQKTNNFVNRHRSTYKPWVD